jgi:hypothetical protein
LLTVIAWAELTAAKRPKIVVIIKLVGLFIQVHSFA